MHQTPSMALLRSFNSVFAPSSTIWTARACLLQTQSTQQNSLFSSTTPAQARKKGAPKKDPRITAIRYHLYHPKTPRPLHFSRNRALRHWTIHRAWQRHLDNQRRTRELDLERQYNAMASACEALRLIDDDGLTEQEAEHYGALQQRSEKEVGRLYRQAMMKDNVWDGVPIEYARMQTETPGRDGWNHGWTR
ncbi:unnamed protein product [Zymoseptoria tritici ST99CH_1A5]|uniref:Uncharacterized protein n=1 Tax=Zymoseptoria tritici ST99CH_1A5 TaxID=1276529 RepID=A0A1Y6LBX7_ZYMTR|nr:unnamed protein product [Zymoseptoria tritici ST99CH_1A5]